jgi:hypothetical protein
MKSNILGRLSSVESNLGEVRIGLQSTESSILHQFSEIPKLSQSIQLLHNQESQNRSKVCDHFQGEHYTIENELKTMKSGIDPFIHDFSLWKLQIVGEIGLLIRDINKFDSNIVLHFLEIFHCFLGTSIRLLYRDREMVLR